MTRSISSLCISTWPTRQPIPRPTSEPTKEPVEYYVADTSGICVSDKDGLKPHWIKMTFSDYNQCCKTARDTELCLKNRPSKDGEPPLPLGHAKQWYVQQSSGLCVSDSEKPKPNWIKDTFSQYDLCCQSSRDVALCQKARPSPSINGGTLGPTPTPPAMFYVDRSTEMCVSNAEKPKVSAPRDIFSINQLPILIDQYVTW